MIEAAAVMDAASKEDTVTITVVINTTTDEGLTDEDLTAETTAERTAEDAVRTTAETVAATVAEAVMTAATARTMAVRGRPCHDSRGGRVRN